MTDSSVQSGGSPREADGFANARTVRMSYEEMLTRQAAGVNPVCREIYLHDADFKAIFGMDKPQFYALRPWRQKDLKRRVGLF